MKARTMTPKGLGQLGLGSALGFSLGTSLKFRSLAFDFYTDTEVLDKLCDVYRLVL